jgi:hypothetical protein
MCPPADVLRECVSGVADELEASATREGDGVSWDTATFERNTLMMSRVAKADLYAGVAGIALFLLEAADALDRPELRDTARAALRWTARIARVLPSYGFYSGRLGIAYVLLRAGMADEALDLARGYEAFEKWYPVADILTGAAGGALGFLHLHAATGEAWTATAAETLLRRVVQSARWLKEGVCWNVRPENVKGLCGVSHGNAGIVLALLEGSRYFDQPAYRTLALQGLRYETECFDAAEGTWPDYRKTTQGSDVEFERDYGSDPEESFAEHSFMDAWCHGAPGIGLTRVRCAELLGEEWLADVRRAVSRTIWKDRSGTLRTFTLCHGLCGNAFLFLEAERLLGDASLRALAEEVGLRAVQSRSTEGTWASGYAPLGRAEDASFMLGNSGIAYFLLHLLAPGRPNVLLPRVNGGAAAEQSIDDGDVARALTASIAPRTLAAAEKATPAIELFPRWRERDEALAVVRSAAGAAKPAAALEAEMLAFWESCRSFALVRHQQWRARKAAMLLRGADLSGVVLRLAPYVRLVEGGDEMVLLRIVDGDVVDQKLTPLAAAVLSYFASPHTLEEAMRELAEGAEGPEGEAVAQAVREQTEQAVAGTILEATILEAVGGASPTAGSD